MIDFQTISDARLGFGQSLIGIARLWRRAADVTLDKIGLSYATATPLRMLAKLGGEARQGAIAQASGVEGPGLVRVVDVLVANGLITRHEDPVDRRAKILSLTSEGIVKCAEIERVLKELRDGILVDIAETELRATIATITRIEERIQQTYNF